MKKQLLHIAATLSLLLMLGVAAAAQTSKVMTVTIPFNFYVGTTLLPAGTYAVYRTSTVSGEAFLLRDADRQAKIIFSARQVQSAEAPEASQLEFRRYEEKYFLARFSTAENNISRELQPSRLERELGKEAARHLAQKGVKPEVVTVTTQ